MITISPLSRSSRAPPLHACSTSKKDLCEAGSQVGSQVGSPAAPAGIRSQAGSQAGRHTSTCTPDSTYMCTLSRILQCVPRVRLQIIEI
jgi:hypothetical protein